MLLLPKRTKYKKQFKGRARGVEVRSNKLVFGSYGIIACEPGRISARQIEATRVAITRQVKRIGKVWIRIFPDVPVTKKPAEVRMGKGKGAVDRWVARVKKDRILFELDGVSKEIALKALKLGASKLPIKTKFVGFH